MKMIGFALLLLFYSSLCKNQFVKLGINETIVGNTDDFYYFKVEQENEFIQIRYHIKTSYYSYKLRDEYDLTVRIGFLYAMSLTLDMLWSGIIKSPILEKESTCEILANPYFNCKSLEEAFIKKDLHCLNVKLV